MLTRARLYALGLGPVYETTPDAAAAVAGAEGEGEEGDDDALGGDSTPGFLDTIKEAVETRRGALEEKLTSEREKEVELEGEEAAAAARARAAHQPKDDKGRFAKKDDDAAAAAAAGTDEDEDAAAAKAAGGAPDDAATKGFIAKLPPRVAGEPDEEIEVEDKALADRINQLRNMALRGSEVAERTAALAAREAEVDEFHEGLATDPVGYVADQVPAEYHEDLVRYLLTSKPELFKKIIADASKWDADPRELELAQEKAKNAREKIQRQATTARSTARQVADARASIIGSLASVVPDDFDAQRAELFRADAVRDIQGYLRQNPNKLLNGEGALALLERNGRLAMYGLKRPEGQPANAPPAKGKGPKADAGKKPAAAAKPDLEKARADGKRMENKAAVRRHAVATAPSGAGGAPVTTAKPPKGLGVKETIAWARQKWGRG